MQGRGKRVTLEEGQEAPAEGASTQHAAPLPSLTSKPGPLTA
jgi:hypothetical protein